MLAHERVMLGGGRNEDDQPDSHADERHRRDADAVVDNRGVAQHQAGDCFGGEAQTAAGNEQSDAHAHASRAGAHVVFVADGILRGCVGHGLRGVVGARGQVAFHQFVDAAVENLANFHQLVHLGVGALCLPFGDGLTANADHHGKLFLRHLTCGP